MLENNLNNTERDINSFIQMHSHMHLFHMTHLLKIQVFVLRMSVSYFRIAADTLVCDERQTCPLFPNFVHVDRNSLQPDQIVRHQSYFAVI